MTTARNTAHHRHEGRPVTPGAVIERRCPVCHQVTVVLTVGDDGVAEADYRVSVVRRRYECDSCASGADR